MNSLRTCILISLSFHAAFFVFHFPSLPFNRGALVSKVDDFHLPVSVDLIQSSDYSEFEKSVSAVVKSDSKSHEILTPLSPPQAVLTDFAQRNQKQPRDRTSVPKVLSHKPSAVSIKAPGKSMHAWNQPPIYPEISRRMGQAGRVIVDTRLDGDGNVISVKIARTSGFQELDQAALDAVRDWKMDLPSNGLLRLFIPITFQLKANSSRGENV